MKKISLKMLFVIVLFLTGNPVLFSQKNGTSDSTKLALLNSLSPQQLETLLNQVIGLLPEEQRNGFEKVLATIKSETPEIVNVNLKDKKVSLIPLSHVCTPVFYDKVKNIVEKYKCDGYVIYYEEIRTDTTKSMDTARLKFRKMIGTEPTRQSFAILKKVFPNVIVQPRYKDLGVTATDINADIDVLQLVEQYEKLYGKINLTPCDFDTKLGALAYPCEKLKNNPSPITLDYRNKHVADLIQSSKDDKILVLYGANHIPSIVDLIQD